MLAARDTECRLHAGMNFALDSIFSLMRHEFCYETSAHLENSNGRRRMGVAINR